MTEIPDDLMAEFVIEQAKEYGEYVEVVDTIGSFGAKRDIEWSIDDIDSDRCDIELDDETVVVSDIIDGRYYEQVLSSSYYHPAEYESYVQEMSVTISMDLNKLPQPKISVVPI